MFLEIQAWKLNDTLVLETYADPVIDQWQFYIEVIPSKNVFCDFESVEVSRRRSGDVQIDLHRDCKLMKHLNFVNILIYL